MYPKFLFSFLLVCFALILTSVGKSECVTETAEDIPAPVESQTSWESYLKAVDNLNKVAIKSREE